MWKKVTKDEYRVLSRYFPSEIRYYINTDAKRLKTNGSAVEVRGEEDSEEGETKVKRRSPRPAGGDTTNDRPGSRKSAVRYNKVIKLGNTSRKVAVYEGTKREKVYESVKDALAKRGGEIRRHELRKILVNDYAFEFKDVDPVLTDLIDDGFLKAQKFETDTGPGF